MAADWTIRNAERHELGLVLELWRRAEESMASADAEQQLSDLLANPAGQLLIATKANDVVGSIVAGYDGWRGTLYRLAVDPTARRQGLGKALVSAAEDWLRERGASRVYAFVETDHDEAVAFWDSTRYTRVPRIDPYFARL